MMKTTSGTWGILEGRSSLGRRPFFSDALSSQGSLARTSLRTLNCRSRRSGSTRSRLLEPRCPPRDQPFREVAVDIMFQHVAGLDVHHKSIVACIRSVQPQGGVVEEVRTFGTMTRDLLHLSDWLAVLGVTHVAMEATGVLWKPVWNILEARFQLLLVNPRDLKQVPGRKSDVRDCQWLAQLLQCGPFRSSFVPPP